MSEIQTKFQNLLSHKNLLIILFDVIYVFMVKQLTFSNKCTKFIIKYYIIIIKYYSFLLRLRFNFIKSKRYKIIDSKIRKHRSGWKTLIGDDDELTKIR